MDILFREQTWLRETDERFDVLSDPNKEPLLDPTADISFVPELLGDIGYFTSQGILQMLAATRATDILYFDGKCAGEIHLENGRT